MTRHWFSDIKAFQRDPLELLERYAAQSNDPFIELALGPAPVFFVNDVNLVKPLLKLSEDVIDKGQLVKKIANVVGEFSLTLSGESHQKRRAILHERLSRGVANTYAGEMAAQIRMVAGQLAAEPVFRADIVGGSLALKLASVALFGHRVVSPSDELAIMTAFHTLEGDLQAEMFRFLPRTPWAYLRDNRRRKEALFIMDHIIGKVARAASESSVLKALQEAGLSEVEIRNELTTMIIAGFHTTGSAVAWICHYLANQPSEVAAIRHEYSDIVDPVGEIPATRLSEAKKSLAFAKEVLRLYPSAWWLTRETKQGLDMAGRNFKAGTTFIISPWVYHRSARYYESPNEFSVDRDHAGAAYMPFGAGARACVGMGVSLLELHLITLEFAATFDFSLVTPAKALKPRSGITLNAPEMLIRQQPRRIRPVSFRDVA